MERLYKTMKEADIINKITNAQVQFSITEEDDILDLGLEEYIEELKKKFASKPENFLLNF